MPNLATTAPGTRVRLAQIAGERSFRRRLMELGLLPGTAVEVIRRVDIGRLVELSVRGSRISVRLDEAQHIHCEPDDAA